jgi:hypothetical protein
MALTRLIKLYINVGGNRQAAGGKQWAHPSDAAGRRWTVNNALVELMNSGSSRSIKRQFLLLGNAGEATPRSVRGLALAARLKMDQVRTAPAGAELFSARPFTLDDKATSIAQDRRYPMGSCRSAGNRCCPIGYAHRPRSLLLQCIFPGPGLEAARQPFFFLQKCTSGVANLNSGVAGTPCARHREPATMRSTPSTKLILSNLERRLQNMRG